MDVVYVMVPLVAGWALDRCFGDPAWLPHPVVGFGKLIGMGERRLNKGKHRKRNGALLAVSLIAGTYGLCWGLRHFLCAACGPAAWLLVASVGVFYCLAGTTLCREVRGVFEAASRSVEEGRKQVARIVGRDTSGLSAQEVRTAALETLAENLSDGVVAPLFWYGLLGIEGMFAYKMVNTLDSMIGYRNERYRLFGCVAARIDDAANYLPARLTALLMVAASGQWKLLGFVRRYGRAHASPNSGYPESALAGILDCRFGGPHDYFGERVWKPFIGSRERPLTTEDMLRSLRINRRTEVLMVGLVLLWQLFWTL